MYRPGWFPEYAPQQQKLFDIIYGVIAQEYYLAGYQHIRTPAVEKNEVLQKGWDEVANQIFWLYGLAQGAEDLKSYAMHFDLTVPFARYVLDWQNDLTFPFKRYQIQPVWRGERTQKGRYKEFWQADIDAIWPESEASKKDYNSFYDADIISTLARTLGNVFSAVQCEETLEVHINDKKVLHTFMQEELQVNEADEKALLALFDKFYKLEEKEFFVQAEKLVGKDGVAKIKELMSLSEEQIKKKYPTIASVLSLVRCDCADNVSITFDPFIVRGLDYYTGTVFETFISGRTDLGSICSGGAYENFTHFLDAKRVYSWVGGSIGLSRLFSILTEEFGLVEAPLADEKSFLVVHFENMLEDAFHIADAVRRAGHGVEIYPLPEKIGKQIQYADKKGLTRVVIFGEAEKQAGEFKVKHLTTGEEKTYKIGDTII